MKRTIIIDTDEGTIELLEDGYNIIEKTFYDEKLVSKAKELITDLVLYNIPF